MLHRLSRSLFVAAALLIAAAAPAQRYFFENISVQDQLPDSKVYAVVQDSTGLLWVGTKAGLTSYDGMMVTSYDAADGLAPGGVCSIFLDKDRRLWCGHLGGGLSVREGRKFRAVRPGTERINDDITAIQQDGKGGLWFGTFGHGAFHSTEMGADSALTGTWLNAQQGLGDLIVGITRLADGGLVFVESSTGLHKWDPATGKVTPLALPGLTDQQRITSFFQDSKGGYWVGTQDHGAFQVDPRSGRTQNYDLPTGMPSSFVFCFGEDRTGSIWIGTWDKGLVRLGPNGPEVFNKGNGLHSQVIRALTCDREGNLLIATNDEGIDIFKGDRFRSFTVDDGLVERHVNAVVHDRAGRTWFGTNGGITILSPGGSTEDLTAQNARLSTNAVRCMAVDGRGVVWVGTEGDGLLECAEGGRGFARHEELSPFLGENTVTALGLGPSGELYVGALGGLIRFRPGQVPDVLKKAEGLAGDHITAIYRDAKGTMWVGSHGSGVSVIARNAPGKAVPVDLGRIVTPTSFAEDEEGRVWVGTETQGVFVLQNGKVVGNYGITNGLLSSMVRSLFTDAKGHLWIGTNKGLNKRKKKDGTFLAFTERSGYTGIESKAGAVCGTSDGGLWFGTANGAVLVAGEKGADKNEPPLIAVRVLKVNLEERDAVDGVDLSHTERDVRIEYGCVSLSDPGAVRYQYMLEGLDQDWQPVTDESNAHYPGLSPGHYVFKVKARNRAGLWSDPPAIYHFTILPPWYRSWWFYTALVIVIGVVTITYIKFRERQLRLRNQVLERKVEERTAEVVAQSREIAGQKVRIEELLLNILPRAVSDELRDTGKATARLFNDVTVMFTDMKGFTTVAEKMTPEQLVTELDECFVRFDEITARYGIEKIKTIGDSYMSACGVPSSDPMHAVKAVMAALDVREEMRRWRHEREAQGKDAWVLRIGLHTGPVVAGVVGKRKFAYDIWGDTVNTASRMESSGVPGEVNISGATYALVKDYFECEHRGQVEAKNKGRIDMYFVRRIKATYSADGEGMRPNARFLQELGVARPVEELA